MRRVACLGLCLWAGLAAAQPLFTPPPIQMLPWPVDVAASWSLLGEDAGGRLVFLEPDATPELHVVTRDGAVSSSPMPRGVTLYGGLSWDLSAVVLLGYRGDSPDRYRLYRIDPAVAAAAPPEPLLTLGPAALPALEAAPAPDLDVLPVGPDDAVCLPLRSGVVCLDLDPGAPDPRLVIDLEGLDAQVTLRGDWAAGALPVGAEGLTGEQWTQGPAAIGGDGRVWARVTREWVGPRRDQTVPAPRYRAVAVVAAGTDGAAAPVPVFGPMPAEAWGPLRGADSLIWDPALHAMAIPVTAWDIGWTAPTSTAGAWIGRGLRLLPADGEGTGYLSLTHALNSLRPAQLRVTGLALRPSPSGWVALIDRAATPGTRDGAVVSITRDLDGLDLDRDTLTAAEEQALGTSDWLRDTDGGGTLDGVELALEGSDPRDWRDDAVVAHGPDGEDWFVDSALIRLRLDVRPDADFVRSYSPRAPACIDGACYAPDGQVVVRYPPPVRRLGGAAVSADGRFVAVTTADGLHRTWFADGRGELYLDAAALAEPLGGRAPRFVEPIPIDPARTWIHVAAEPEHGPVILLCTEGRCAVAFDPAAARADSGLAGQPEHVSVTDGTHDVYVGSTRVVAWDATHERLLVQIAGPLDGWLLALSDQLPPAVIEQPATWAGANLPEYTRLPDLGPPVPVTLPDWTVQTVEGDHIGPKGRVTDARQFLPTGFSVFPHLHEPVTSAWHGTLLGALCCGNHEDGLYEMVRAPRRLDPGDVVALRPVPVSVTIEGESVGHQLYRSGPRGGFRPLWDGVNLDIGDVGGVDITADGLLCVADVGRDLLWIFEPADPEGRVPDLVIDAPAVAGIRDCQWDGQAPGDLLVLADDPPRLLRRHGATAELSPVEPDGPLPSRPRALQRRPDGSVAVVGDDVRGRVWLPDGRVAQMAPGSFALEVDGAPVADVPLLHVAVGETTPPSIEAEVDLAARPDGLIVVAAKGAPSAPGAGVIQTYVWAVDPVGGRVEKLGVNRLYAILGGGLAVVPGGAARDPWSGAPLAGGRDAEQPPRPPSGGEPVPDEGGCSAAPGADGSDGASVLLLALLAVRRRPPR